MTAVGRQMVKHMGQALDSGRHQSGGRDFHARLLSRATRQETGADIDYHEVGGLLDRMGIPANRRDYRRRIDVLRETLPVWLEAADTNRVSQIRMPPPIV